MPHGREAAGCIINSYLFQRLAGEFYVENSTWRIYERSYYKFFSQNSTLKNDNIIFSCYQQKIMGSYDKIVHATFDSQLLPQIQNQVNQLLGLARATKGQRNNQFRCLGNLVPFFMNQFFHWAHDQSNHKERRRVYKSLLNLKNSLNSPQKKFELGSLKFICSDKKHTHVRQAWEDFINNHAINYLKNNTRIQRNIANYQWGLQLLQKELRKPQPYKRFLSIIRKSVCPELHLDEGMVEVQLDSSNPVFSQDFDISSNQQGFDILSIFKPYRF